MLRSAARFWSAPAERSGDGALDFPRTALLPESGVEMKVEDDFVAVFTGILCTFMLPSLA
jgi:hypothetical protein